VSGEHTHGHGHHDHAALAARAGARHRHRLLVAFVLIGGYLVVEVVAGLLTRSLALLSDAGHMLTDVVGLGMALAAIQLATRYGAARGTAAEDSSHTFGLYRLEILAAFVNAILLIGVAGYVLVEAVRRLGHQPEIESGPMLVVAVVGLGVNLVAFWLLRAGAKESLNVQAAYLEVVADTLGSVGVIAAAALLWAFDWAWVDPVVAAAIGVWIVPRTIRLGGQAVRILLQSAPPHIVMADLRADLVALPDVVGIHDLHVWTLTSGMEAASVHVVSAEGSDHHAVLDQARELLAGRYGIAHATLQVEPESHEGCADVTW
jgi:cobalt-zinc-cadmium efflux system protein